MQNGEYGFWHRLVAWQLRRRSWIFGFMILLTGLFTYSVAYKLQIKTDFFELYPPNHPYIKLYKEFRKMFGSANEISIILERTDGKDIYQPETMKKLDELTKGVLLIRGVNPQQVSSAVHPRVKQVTVNAYGIGVFPLTFPLEGYPKTQEECEVFRKNVYSNEGIRGFYVGLDDKSATVYAGFWEEGLDFAYLYGAINELMARVEDSSHKCHVSGYPVLYAWMDHYKTTVLLVLLATIGTMVVILFLYFRTLRGVLIPLISGGLSALWGLGFGGLLGLSMDPLLLVVPVLLAARALSHSCQCMDRCRQEYALIGDEREAIVRAYGAVYPPALLAIVTDGLGCLTIAIATIPLMQKLAFISSFWIISIFMGVVVLNPVLLTFVGLSGFERSAGEGGEETAKTQSFLSLAYGLAIERLHRLSGPGWKWASACVLLVVVVAGGAYSTMKLKIGDSSAGGAILYGDHPYNVAAGKMNESFVGGSRLVVVVKGKEKEAIKDSKTLQTMEKLGNFMQNNIPEVGGTMSLTDLVRRINRTYHDGSPKWEIIPENKRHLGLIYFMLGSAMAPGEMDQYVSLPDYTHSNVTAFFRKYNSTTIKDAIAKTKTFAERVNADPESKVEIKLAGGILGILAAVNEEVEWSYWAILVAIFTSTFALCVTTYRSVKAAFILILPLYLSQVVCELIMIAFHIDLNIDSLPVASVGVGVGIDYGIYLMSRIKEECAKTEDFERAKLIALSSVGKMVMFTAITMILGLVFWLFSPLKFQAEMGLLILILMGLNGFGALVFIPSLVSILKPGFVVKKGVAQGI